MSPAKTAEPIEMTFGVRTQVGPGNHVLDGVQIPHGKGQFWGKGAPIVKYIWTFCHELCENGLTNRLAVLVVDSGGPKEAQVQSYSPGGANVPSWEGTLAQPGEYD